MKPPRVKSDSFKTILLAIVLIFLISTLIVSPGSFAGAIQPGADLTQETPRDVYDLEISYQPMYLDGEKKSVRATAINGSVPGPVVYLREGDTIQLNVTNSLLDSEHSSIHWHGILVPPEMDGVPGVSFKGIPPGATYKYEYEVIQAGTYWYHSHSAFQEETGTYGPLVIEPKGDDPHDYDRDYAVLLSDWPEETPENILRNLKLGEHYYNFQQRTFFDFLSDINTNGFKQTLGERMAWGKMRMSPVDLSDVSGAAYTYLMNGKSPDMNWTALFDTGETVRLRFINASAMSTFDVHIPGLKMEVIMADGKFVEPTPIDEFRISVAETYDVLVRPESKPYTIFAETHDRSGFTRGTLSPDVDLEADIPLTRKRPIRTLESIGMGEMANFSFGANDHSMDHDTEIILTPGLAPSPGPDPLTNKNPIDVAMINHNPVLKMDQPGIGLGNDGRHVLTYSDLVSAEPQPYEARVDREMTVHLTGNMERFRFSFDGRKYSDHPGPYLFRHNERLRLWLVNHTMMEHPIHLHGMWMQVENGQPHEKIPYKHTVLVKPGEKLPVLITPIKRGDWAFHCHLLYHMDAGMFQEVRVK